ncbi:Fic family protein [Xanthomonas bromi]|uniref:Fic family protein n=1 Tax=Xanthomonas bromi TaxID=56449 RepID=UPI001ADFCB27|nr:Fic family protein [Xanthomonas bromi]
MTSFLDQCERQVQRVGAANGADFHRASWRIRRWIYPSHKLQSFLEIEHQDLELVEQAEVADRVDYQEWIKKAGDNLSINEITALNQTFTKRLSGMRTYAASLAQHSHGAERILLPEWEKAQDRMRQIVELVNEEALGQGIVAATRALVLINNAHAFSDGNGRTARAVFNWILSRSKMNDPFYITLKTLSAYSFGAYELHLREAEIFSRWDGVFRFHAQAVRTALDVHEESSY